MSDMTIVVEIENTYPDQTITKRYTRVVPMPLLNDDDMEEWWEDEIFPLTGTGPEMSDQYAIYEAKIIKCDELPQLVGETHEWGV